MSSPGGTSAPAGSWMNPATEQHGLRRYVATLRERFWLIVLTTLLTTAAAAIYVATAPKVYKAESDLLVSPVPSDDPALEGLALIRTSSDPTRDVETASRLITTVDVARRARSNLHLRQSAPALLEQVTAEPVAQSNIVSVTATAHSPQLAAALANGFAVAAIQNRTVQLHRQLDLQIPQLRARVRAFPTAQGTTNGLDALRTQLGELETLRAGADPTLLLETRADPPTAPDSPKPLLSLLAGLFAGLILGIGGAFAIQVLDPRLRREEQLREAYQLPILARIPNERRRRGRTAGALAPQELSRSGLEGYRTLRATLAAFGASVPGPRSVLITSPSASEGKTTTALNLAYSLVVGGSRVILIEADLRRPALGLALGIEPTVGTGSVLLGTVPLKDALVSTKPYGGYLRMLLADSLGPASISVADRLSLPGVHTLVEDAKQLADYVVIDSPPLSEVIDALPLAQAADDVVVTVRLNRSPLTKLARLGELLARHGVRPTGFAVIGVPGADAGGYYYYAGEPNGASPTRRRRASEEDRELTV